MEPISINPEGIKNLLDNLEANKASGPDQSPSRFFKKYANKITPNLQSLLTSRPPWKHATVVPVFKKGDRKFPSNYCTA